MLKNENACLRDELTKKTQAISKFKKWQANAVEWKIAELLEDSKTILEEPLPSKLVKNLNKIAKYAEEIRLRQCNMKAVLKKVLKDEQIMGILTKYANEDNESEEE